MSITFALINEQHMRQQLYYMYVHYGLSIGQSLYQRIEFPFSNVQPILQ